MAYGTGKSPSSCGSAPRAAYRLSLPAAYFILFMLPKLPRLVAAAMIALAAIPVAAAGAECVNGYPTISYSPLPDCSCFNGSSAGTRVYAIVAHLYVSTNGTTKQLPINSAISCDARHLYVLSHNDHQRHVFPIQATIKKVYINGTEAFFPWETPPSWLIQAIRNGNATLLRVY